MPAHSIGPWYAVDLTEVTAPEDRDGNCLEIWDCECLTVATPRRGGDWPGEYQGNAQLIATAPDLLRACIEVLQEVDKARSHNRPGGVRTNGGPPMLHGLAPSYLQQLERLMEVVVTRAGVVIEPGDPEEDDVYYVESDDMALMQRKLLHEDCK